MPIETRIRTSVTVKNIVVSLVCLGFGLWGWYDYSVKIPRERKDFEEFVTADKLRGELEAAARVMPLTDEQKQQFKDVTATLARFTEKPSEPSSYDDDIQLWVYIVGCGVLGTPWGIWSQWRLSRKKFRYDDDGTFHAREGTFPPDAIADIDMTRWMETSVATVVLADGRRIDLDDHYYQGVEDIVAKLAARFHEGKWTSDARPIGDPKSRDTKKALEETLAGAERADSDDSERPA